MAVTLDAPARDIGTHVGVQLRWWDRSPDPSDASPRTKGFETSLVEAVAGGERIGYLRVSAVTDELVAAVAPDGLTYQCNVRGWCCNLEDRRDLWVRAHLYHGRSPRSAPELSSRSLRASDAPTGSTLDDDLAVIAAHYEPERQRWIAYHQVPTVAYSHVDEPHRRRGLGTAMYLAASEQLSRTGWGLRASGLQSAEAAALWDRLDADGLTTLIELHDPYRGEPVAHRYLRH